MHIHGPNDRNARRSHLQLCDDGLHNQKPARDSPLVNLWSHFIIPKLISLRIEGTNVWSGQQVQSYNSNAIAWGGLAKDLFSSGARFQWLAWAFLIGFLIPFPTYILHRLFPKAGWGYWNLAIITWYIGWLCVGINSNILPWFVVGFWSQFWLRKYRADWFIKYNYILSAGMDGMSIIPYYGLQTLSFSWLLHFL